MKLIIMLLLSILPSNLFSQNFYASDSFVNADANVYVMPTSSASTSGFADVKVYISSSAVFADLVFYPAICNRNFANVELNLVSSSNMANLIAYIATVQGFADINIFFSPIQNIDDHVLCFSEQVSVRERHMMGVAAAAYMLENDIVR